MIPQFALRLIAGLSLCWLLYPRPQITSGFFRIQNLLTLGLGVLAALTLEQLSTEATRPWLGQTPLLGITVLLAVLSFGGSALWTLERRTAGTWLAFAIAVGSALALAGAVPVQLADSGHWSALSWLAAIASAWLIGAATGAMLLGHWYLTATGMPLAPLQRANQMFLCAVGLRLAIALVAAGTWGLGESHPVWQLLRWTAGLFGPLALGLLVPRVLIHRNTQSATGILFAAVVLIFMGEMAAALLERELGRIA